MTEVSRRRWYQFSLKRLLIVMARAPPLLAASYWMVQEGGIAAIVVLIPIFWIAIFVDLFRNRTLSSNARIGWLLVMLLSCWMGALLYVCVRFYDWIADELPSPIADKTADEKS